jgi:hypothetical protein
MTVLVTDLRGAHQIDAAVKALGGARQRIEVFREIHSGRSRVKTATQIADAIGIARKRVLEEAVKLRHKGIIGEATRNGEVAYQRDNFYYVHIDRIIREAIQGRGKALPSKTERRRAAGPVRSRRPAMPSSRPRRRSSRRRYDLFLSHASEDKRAIARPLYTALKKAGMSVWFDEETLTIGDSLRTKIDEGLARCRYGIVILSPKFFAKRWPKKELDGLVAREDASGEKVILPIWHNVNKAQVTKFSPMLAGLLAGRSTDGIPKLVDDIKAAVRPVRRWATRR